MKAVIYGASGQDGFYLAQLCETAGIKVVSFARSEGPWARGDVGNYADVYELISLRKPDFVFHLAANSTTRHEALFENQHTIAMGTINLLEACYRSSPETKILLA